MMSSKIEVAVEFLLGPDCPLVTEVSFRRIEGTAGGISRLEFLVSDRGLHNHRYVDWRRIERDGVSAKEWVRRMYESAKAEIEASIRGGK